MPVKIADALGLLLIAGAGVWFLTEALSMDDSGDGGVGPGFLPTVLAVLLLCACGLRLVKLLTESPRGAFEIPYGKDIAVVSILTVLFVLAWVLFVPFIVASSVYMFLVMALLTNDGRRCAAKHLAINTSVAITVSVGVFVAFSSLLNISL